MRSLLSALQFLTIVPIKTKGVDANLPKAMIYFPLVGLLLGLFLVGVNNLLAILNFDGFVLNIILVISLIIITGGLHLDGLADTFDALLSGKDKEEMLKIMRDSHIGVMGVLSLICILLLKISLLSSIDTSSKIASLILTCVLSRWSLVFSIFSFPYARQEGKAKVFTTGINFKIFILATVITLTLAIIIWRLKGLFIFGIIAMSIYIIDKFLNNKFGGITGDTLGATNELAEVITLFSIYAIGRINP